MMGVLRRRKQVRRLPQATPAVYYVFRIADWEWNFMFGTGLDDDGRHSDFRHLEIVGEVVRPKGLHGRGIRLVFLPDASLNISSAAQQEIPQAGVLRSTGRHLEALCSMPADVLPSVLQMLIGNRYGYVICAGEHVKNGRARFLRYDFHRTISPEDLPAEA